MFEYFFILGTIFLILAGTLDEFRVNKFLSVSILTVIFLISTLPDINIKYTFYFSWASVLIILLLVIMYVIMPKEHISSLIYSTILGLLIWAIVTLAPSIDNWYFKSIVFSFFGAMLAETYIQSSVISVLACVICNIFSVLITTDFELFTFAIFIGNGKTEIVVSMLLPIIIMALAEKKTKEITLESIHGAS